MVLVVPSNQMNLLWIESLKSKQETNSLERMASSVDKVSKENVVKVLDIALFPIQEGTSKESEKVQEIGELPVNISKYFNRSPY